MREEYHLCELYKSQEVGNKVNARGCTVGGWTIVFSNTVRDLEFVLQVCTRDYEIRICSGEVKEGVVCGDKRVEVKRVRECS